MLLCQIGAEELAGPGMHRHQANASREFAATFDGTEKFIPFAS